MSETKAVAGGLQALFSRPKKYYVSTSADCSGHSPFSNTSAPVITLSPSPSSLRKTMPMRQL